MNKVVATTQETAATPRMELAAKLHAQAAFGVFIMGQAIKRIHDDRLYVELGCNSFKEYILEMTTISRSQAYLSIKIAERFESYAGGPGGVQPLELTGGDNGVFQPLDTLLSDIGPRRLSEMINLDDSDLADLMDGNIVGEGADRFTLEELMSMKASEAAAKLKEHKKKTRGEIQRLEEDNLKLKSEAGNKDEEIERLQKDLEDFKDLDLLYGPKATKTASKRILLDKADAVLDLFRQALAQADVVKKDPAALHEKVAALHKKLDMVATLMRQSYAFLFVDAS